MNGACFTETSQCGYWRREGEPMTGIEYPCGPTEDGELRARCTYFIGGSFVNCCGVVLICGKCQHWQANVLAHPESEAPGSLRICAKSETTHWGSWKPCWEAMTAEQVLEAANDDGRLF